MQDLLCLVEPLIPRLRRYARTLMHDRAAADDLVQDCLERVVSRWGQRRPEGDVRAWAFTILHNLAANRRRADTRQGTPVAPEDVTEALLAHPPTQEDGLRHRDVTRALDALPEDQRAVLLLVSVEDLTYAEAALVLDIPIGTVMSRLSRARERLARYLAVDGAIPAASPTLRRVK